MICVLHCVPTTQSQTIFCHHILHPCVETLQGQAGSWYSCRWKISTEPLGCQARLYSQVGKPRTLQVPYLSACLMSRPLLPRVAPIVAPVPLCVSHHHHPQQGVPTCLSTRGEKSRQDARTLHNIT